MFHIDDKIKFAKRAASSLKLQDQVFLMLKIIRNFFVTQILTIFFLAVFSNNAFNLHKSFFQFKNKKYFITSHIL